VVEKQLKGFMLFVRQQGVVGLAVGLVLGTAIKSVVDSLVASILNPLIGLLTGGVNLNDKFFCLSKSGTECVNKLAYGSFISTVISFLTIAAVVYFGVKGLKLDLELAEIERRMAASKENLSPLRRIKRFVKPSDEALALLFHGAPPEAQANGSRLARLLKAFPLDLLWPRPLAEAISSSGGVHADEIDERLMLRKLPGVFVAGEMIDWDAPTGGFLIQGCVSTGALAAAGIDGLNS
jgi:large conductance mechanosensitive channel protein